MSQQEEEPSRYTRILVVKPALSQMYDQLLPKSKSLETACKNYCTHTSAPRHVRVPRSRNFSDCLRSSVKNGCRGESIKNSSYTAFACSVSRKRPAVPNFVRSCSKKPTLHAKKRQRFAQVDRRTLSDCIPPLFFFFFFFFFYVSLRNKASVAHTGWKKNTGWNNEVEKVHLPKINK